MLARFYDDTIKKWPNYQGGDSAEAKQQYDHYTLALITPHAFYEVVMKQLIVDERQVEKKQECECWMLADNADAYPSLMHYRPQMLMPLLLNFSDQWANYFTIGICVLILV